MKKITRFFCVIVLSMSIMTPISSVLADNIDHSKARNVAAYFMAAQFGNKAITAESLELVYEIPNIEKGISTLYAFNTADKRGFVIVAGTDCVDPIVAYSTDGALDPGNIPPAMQWWLGEQANMIACCQNNAFEAGDRVLASWRTLEEQRLPYFGQNSKAVVRLLRTKWNQNYPYNVLCPTVSNGNNDNRGRAYVGCVATAMSQILCYWEYPVVGQGSKTYHVSEAGLDTTLSLDFSQSRFDYENMPDKLDASATEDQINAVAFLGYNCGVAVEMGYDGEGSGTLSEYVVDALSANFKYVADSLRFYSRGSMLYNNPETTTNPNDRDTAWVELICNEILKKRPVYYAGRSPYGGRDAGHAFVCEGLNTSTKMLYFNWGWGGSGDCWCNVFTAQLKPSASPQQGTTYNFMESNRIITGIVPPQDSIHINMENVVEPENPFVGALYPNPASTHVTVSYMLTDDSPAIMQVFDASGRMVDEIRLSPVCTQVSFPVGNLDPGIYFCRINGYTKKFVVK
ncbi:MAG: thiol protease/hemagglutinin PrtT [Bacteroidales bacterium]|nr:thiol protease/hemagglutinin PrtT [Bacteroidales bacterium]